MLIVSQDGTNIANMNQVASIAIIYKEADIACFYPFLCEGELYYETLGKYSSPERAKAVLKELWKAKWEGWEVFEMPLDDKKPRNCENCENDKCPYTQLEDKYKPLECYYHDVDMPF